MNLVIKDAARQIAGRVASAIGGFLVITLITPYLGPLRFGDYSTILKYFAIWSAFADFGVYVIALKELGKIKKKEGKVARSEQLITHSQRNGKSHEQQTTHGGLSQDSSVVPPSEGHTSDQDTVNAERSEASYEGDSKDTGTRLVGRVVNDLTLSTGYSKFVSLRFFMIVSVYTLALVIAYLIPAYSSNPYLIRGLPLGMVFSASFMASGILQLPLQLFRKMEQVSIALILARVSQLAVLAGTVYWWFTTPAFESGGGQDAFMMIILSVVVSGIIQCMYTRRQGSKFLQFTLQRDRSFFKKVIGGNWKYGLAYYLSSFHTLLVLMVFSWLYPTTDGYTYVGVWALALSLVEILLIVPSALGNSLIHDVSGLARNDQKNRYSALLQLVTWIGSVVMIMCALFAPHVIQLMSGSDYLTTATSIGSDTILPFLSFVLLLSFIRQVHNYLFVTTGHQNTLFGINLFGVSVGLIIGLPLIITYGLWGGIITQIVLEVLFLGGSLRVAYKQSISLKFPRKTVLRGLTTALVCRIRVAPYLSQFINSLTLWIPLACICLGVLVGGSWKGVKRTLRRL